MIEIDGAAGEGGGQILRSSLALSAATGQPVRIVNARANRKPAGLMRQHRTAVRAVAQICDGAIEGDAIGSQTITLRPGPVCAGAYKIEIGTAGSANLVLQAMLPALLLADGPSEITITGGTHNPGAPPFEFTDEAYLPALAAMGHDVEARLDAYGFAPAGGGSMTVRVTPTDTPRPFEQMTRGPEIDRSLEAAISNLPGDIAARELSKAGPALEVEEANRAIRTRPSAGPGNMLLARFRFAALTAVYAGFGERNLSSEKVASRIAKPARAFLQSEAAITHHLADQLLLPMALGAGGRFTTVRPSLHAITNAEVIMRFLDRRITFGKAGADNVTLCSVA